MAFNIPEEIFLAGAEQEKVYNTNAVDVSITPFSMGKGLSSTDICAFQIDRVSLWGCKSSGEGRHLLFTRRRFTLLQNAVMIGVR